MLRRRLASSEAELEQLRRTCLRLRDDLRAKSAAAQVDAGVVRMRRQRADPRAVPALLQQGARGGQRPDASDAISVCQ